MTRINTNVSSLNAQKSLARTGVQLQEALTRLSTGLRINVGKDDPAGLIASEILRSDIVSTQKAISNTERANQMIATADSALGQVSSLLNDIRALVEEAANKGALSDEQIAANQLQIDSSLSAINRVAQTTKFQGRGLIDGSLDFVTTASTIATIESLTVNQANLGTAGQVDVNVDMTTAAIQATVTSASGDARATADLKFAPRSRVTFNAGATFIDIMGPSMGPQYEGVTMVWDGTSVAAKGNVAANYDPDSKVLTVTFNDGTDDLDDIVTGIETDTDFEAVVKAGDGAVVAATVTAAPEFDSPYLTFTAAEPGQDMNGVSIAVQFAAVAAPVAAYSAVSKRLVITIDTAANTDLDALKVSLDAQLTGIFNVTASAAAGDANVYGADANVRLVEAKAVADTLSTGYLHSGFSASTNATATISFAPSAAMVLLTSGPNATIDVKSVALGTAANDVTVSVVDDALVTQGNEYAVYDSQAKTLVVHYDETNSTVQDIVNAIGALDEWTATLQSGTGTDTVDDDATQTAVTTGADSLEIAALVEGADYNHVQISLETVEDLGATPQVSYDETDKTLTIRVDSALATNLSAINTAINGLTDFSSAVISHGTGRVRGALVDSTAFANTSATGGNTLLADLVLEIGGKNGAEVFNFSQGTSVNQMATAIGLVSDSTGVSATQSAGLLTMTSTEYGSKQFAAATVTSEGTAGAFKNALSDYRATGTDAVATINGIAAVADGNTLAIITSTLDLRLQVTAGSTADFNFAITGGGALFQLGPEVVANQQARMGIQSVNTARLGGADGKLYQLASGQAASLANDVGLAAKIVDEATTAVTTLRGRLGAFQKTTLDTNIKALSDTVVALTEAESSIRDADFATETANLTRAQILSQSGMAVLSIANSQPQNVLALLRNL